MRRFLLIAAGLLTTGFGAWSQNFQVSGGTTYSVALCASGNIITWGDNSSGQLARKALKSTVVTNYSGKTTTIQYDNVPTAVSLTDPQTKAPITVLAVDAGSGSHAIAIACDSTVWTWGNNQHGQLGNGFGSYGTYKTVCSDITSVDFTGTSPLICNKAVPQHVVAGETAGNFGSLSGTKGDPYSGVLTHVQSISAGASGSFAIVKNPKTGKTNLVSWGTNKEYAPYNDATGLLGNNSTIPGCAYPVFVKYKDKNGVIQNLENVIAVDAGDNNCYALVDDDGDGAGTVYGWGNNAYNNINPISNKNPIYASPIYIDAAGTIPLTGIVKISAGDMFMLAYQDQSLGGYVYTIGSEWALPDNSTPRPTTRANGKDQWLNPKEAAKVVSGAASAYNGDAQYLTNVKGISAGQSSAMAIVGLTINGISSNYVVGWGGAYGSEDAPNKGASANALAANDNIGSAVPRMAYRRNWRTNTNVLMDSVYEISDGDGVTYAIRNEKDKNGTMIRQLYVTGTNGAGQLGFPITNTGLNVFTKLDLPACDVAAPCAKADLRPLSICPASYQTAYSGSEGVLTYHYVWQRYDSTGSYTYDGLPGWYEVGTPADVSNVDPTKWKFDATTDKSTYPVDMNGYWKVKIYDNRATSGCGACPVSVDSAIVSYNTAPFDTMPGTWCDNSTFARTFSILNGSYGAASANKKFVFYGSDVATKPLAYLNNADFKSWTASTPLLATSDLEKLNDSTYRYWVADSTTIASIALASTATTVTESNNYNVTAGQIPDVAHTLFFAYSNLNFESFNLYYINRDILAEGRVSITPLIYSATEGMANGQAGFIQSKTPIFTGTTQIFTAGASNGSSAGTILPITVKLNTILQGTLNGKAYILAFKVETITGNSYLQGQQAVMNTIFPVSDALGLISIRNSSRLDISTNGIRAVPEQQSYPIPNNWVIKKITEYPCGRIPIMVKRNCPKCTPAYNEKFGETMRAKATANDVCSGAVVSIETNSVNASYGNSTIEFAWFKGKPTASATPVKAWTKGANSSFSFTAANTESANDWYVVARDASLPNSLLCYDTAYVTVKEHTTPSYKITGGGFYCDGKSSPSIGVQLGSIQADTTGKTPWQIFYHFNTATAGAKQSYTVTSAANEQMHKFANLGTGLFVLDSIADKYCGVKALAADTLRNAPLVIDTVWNSKSVFASCSSVAAPMIAVNQIAGNTTKTYNWMYKKNGASAYMAISGLTTSLSKPAAGEYYVEFTSATGTVTCTKQSAIRTVTRYPLPQFTLLNEQTYCEGATVAPISLKITADTVLANKYGAWTLTPSINGTAKAALSVAAGTSLPTVALGSDAGIYKATLKNTVTGCTATVNPSAKIVINKTSAKTIDVTACKQFVYNNKTYDKSGTFTEKLTNTVGCDSIVTLNLTINTFEKDTVYGHYYEEMRDTLNYPLYVRIQNDTTRNATSCDLIRTSIDTARLFYRETINALACQSYTLNGKTYTKAGTYKDTVVRKNYSVYQVINVQFGSKSEKTLNETACKSFTFAGKTLTTSGTYRDTVKTKAGCDSITILNLTVNKYVNLPKQIKACGSASFLGKEYKASGVYHDTVKNPNGCDTAYTIYAQIGQAKDSVYSVTACKSYKFKGQLVRLSGVYKDTLKTVAGCDSFVTASITIQNQVAVNLVKNKTIEITDTVG